MNEVKLQKVVEVENVKDIDQRLKVSQATAHLVFDRDAVLIASGFNRADKIYENIMDEYAKSGWYNDETHTIATSQFLSLFHYFADCLVDCGYNQDDLNDEILSVIALNEEKAREEESLNNESIIKKFKEKRKIVFGLHND